MMRIGIWPWVLGLFILVACAVYALSQPAHAHDIYTGVHGKNGQLCCGGDDCSATIWREHGAEYEFLTRENKWVSIPYDRVTFLPVPGDPPNDDEHHGHLCYRKATDGDLQKNAGNVFGDIFLYCAFAPPGSI